MDEFEKYLTGWALTADGEPFFTPSSKLLPVRYQHLPCMLKIAVSSEERTGGQLMVWWNGDAAARVLAHDDHALLLERATGKNSLTTMAKNNQDDQATTIICAVVTKLHAHTNTCLPPPLVPLYHWFKTLDDAAQYNSVLRQAAITASKLLHSPEQNVILHGDIHHANILDFGVRGWLAIDAKGLLGERGFDFANIVCNPDAATATKPSRLEQQISIVANAANLDYHRLMKWILAYAGLSAAWHFEDGTNPELALSIVRLASSALNMAP